MNWKITPEEFLREIGADYKKRGKWLTLRNCIFCDGAEDGDSFSLCVHVTDGNYFCHRAKSCGERGSFWKLIQSFGREPREYLGERRSTKNFVYGRK